MDPVLLHPAVPHCTAVCVVVGAVLQSSGPAAPAAASATQRPAEQWAAVAVGDQLGRVTLLQPEGRCGSAPPRLEAADGSPVTALLWRSHSLGAYLVVGNGAGTAVVHSEGRALCEVSLGRPVAALLEQVAANGERSLVAVDARGLVRSFAHSSGLVQGSAALSALLDDADVAPVRAAASGRVGSIVCLAVAPGDGPVALLAGGKLVGRISGPPRCHDVVSDGADGLILAGDDGWLYRFRPAADDRVAARWAHVGHPVLKLRAAGPVVVCAGHFDGLRVFDLLAGSPLPPIHLGDWAHCLDAALLPDGSVQLAAGLHDGRVFVCRVR